MFSEKEIQSNLEKAQELKGYIDEVLLETQKMIEKSDTSGIVAKLKDQEEFIHNIEEELQKKEEALL